jgi:hypothetical protein
MGTKREKIKPATLPASGENAPPAPPVTPPPANPDPAPSFILFRQGKKVASVSEADTYAVRPIEGVTVDAQDIMADLAEAHPQSRFLWLSTPVKAPKE